MDNSQGTRPRECRGGFSAVPFLPRGSLRVLFPRVGLQSRRRVWLLSVWLVLARCTRLDSCVFFLCSFCCPSFFVVSRCVTRRRFGTSVSRAAPACSCSHGAWPAGSGVFSRLFFAFCPARSGPCSGASVIFVRNLSIFRLAAFWGTVSGSWACRV